VSQVGRTLIDFANYLLLPPRLDFTLVFSVNFLEGFLMVRAEAGRRGTVQSITPPQRGC